jgi:hypothetical protein
MPHLRPWTQAHAHHHHPPGQFMRRVEGSLDLVIVALGVILAVAMVYGLVTANGHPAYFDRYWISAWR